MVLGVVDGGAALPEVRATANEEAFVGRYRRAKRMLWVSLAFAGGVVVFEEVIRQGWLAP